MKELRRKRAVAARKRNRRDVMNNIPDPTGFERNNVLFNYP